MKCKGERNNGALENNLILPCQPESDFFLGYMKKILHYARWFGVAGSESKFWRAWGLCLLTGLIVIECTAILRVVRALGGLTMDTTGSRSITARFSGTIFYTTAILSLVLSWRFSASWTKLSKTWTSMDKSIALSLPPDRNLKRKMIVTTIFLVSFGLCEHILSMIANIGLDCPVSLILKNYILASNGFLFRTKNYSLWLALPILFLSEIATILWNFHDLLIVLLSMGLKSRYIRLNDYVSRVIEREKKEYKIWNEHTRSLKSYNWRKIREAYVQQAHLVRIFDKSVGGILVLSSSSNFYFICLQLFIGITQGFEIDQLRRLYYLISLIWVTVRTSFTILAAANINVESRSALQYLHTCDTKFYNVEIERLQNQLSQYNVFLSGMGLFYITRTMLLKMAAAIITYELVLIEFDSK